MVGAEGVAVSTVKLVTLSAADVLPAWSLTVIVQSLYVPSASSLNVIVLFPDAGAVVVDAQLPP